MSAILEEAIEEVRTLPPEEQQQLRELASGFSEFLLMALVFWLLDKNLEKASLDEMRSRLLQLNREMPRTGLATQSMQSQRAIRAGQIRGKYRDVLSSSEEFISRKAAETAKEDRAR
jgi:hypothetical protein